MGVTEILIGSGTDVLSGCRISLVGASVWEIQNPLFPRVFESGCLLHGGELVDQCRLGEHFVKKEEEESREEEKNSFRRGGKDRDGCSPQV